MKLQTIIAVVLAGVCGVIAAVGAGTVFIDPLFALLPMMFPELFPFAVVLAATIHVAYRILPGNRAAVLALFLLTLGAIQVAALLRLARFGEPHLITLSLVYAMTVVLVYHLTLSFGAQD